MTSQIPKDRTVDALDEVWASIRDLVGSLGEDAWATATCLPGWDVRAVVAHVLGTELMLMGESPSIGFDREVDGADAPHVLNDIGAMNEGWVRTLSAVPTVELLETFDRVTAARMAALRAMSQSDWDAESLTPAGRDSFGRFMQIRVMDCWFHEQDVRETLDRPGHEGGSAVEVTLDEVATAMGFVVGKRAAAPTGSRVRFELTGASGRVIDVEVGDRAQVVDQLSGEPTVTITMPAVPFTRLCGGRRSRRSVDAQISVTGHEPLGDRVVDHLAYTI